MCTVTYLPGNNGSFWLTSSRDEKSVRPAAAPPKIYQRNDQQLLFPKDPQAGGTWIACSVSGRICCLLNGAYEAHISSPPYKMSRGLVVLDVFAYHSAEQFYKEYNFLGIEPFTLLIFDEKNSVEIRWDGTKNYIHTIDLASPHIWSSSTLYDLEVRRKREKWFKDWMGRTAGFSTDSIRKFHYLGGEGDPENDIRVNRNNRLFTVSITSIEKQQNFPLKMIYYDLINHTTYSAGF